MGNNVFHACLQFSNIASVLGDARRRIVQDLFDFRWCKRTKSPPPKRFVIYYAIQDQTVVIHIPVLNFLGCTKALFIGRIFFDCYVRVFRIVAYDLFYSIETLNNRICTTIIFFFRWAFSKNLSYIFFDFGGRWWQLVVRCTVLRQVVISRMTVPPMDLILVRIFMAPSCERHFAERNKTASLLKLNS